MKIWFDLSNSPHINMFHDLIRELESDGHEIIITSRPLANTVQLLDQRGLKHTVIGEHYGKNIYKKIFGYPIRVLQLRKFLAPLKPDLAISQSSFHSPIVAKLLGIPSIYTNDNEHAMGNKPAFIFASKILIPENLAIEKIAKLGVNAKKITQYPGVKEGIYLWSKGERIQQKRKANTDNTIKIFIRPEPQTAQYYKGKENFLDEMLLTLQHKYKICVLTRDNQQYIHYKQDKFDKLNVPDKPIDFETIATQCTIFIGAGGSMTRELAILGIPTISVYQDELLDVDGYLLEKKLMRHEPNLTEEKVDSFLNELNQQSPSLELMEKGKKAFQLFKTEIIKFKVK
jgi:predicted glycosyltransferase